MPIQTERIAVGIYHHRWISHVTAEEVLAAFEIELEMYKEDNIECYIAIIDGEKVRTLPLNISKLRQIKSGSEIATLVYKAPRVGRKIGEIVSAIVNLPIEFFEDWDATLTRAKELLEEHEISVFQHESV